MARIKCTEDFKQLRAVIKVIGLGGAGGNAVNRMAEAGLKDVELIAANTDAQALKSNRAPVRIQLGEETTRGLGVGGDPTKGRASAEESRDQLQEVLSGADLIFITAGMGGGTGTGVAPVAAEIARSTKALVIGVVTRPFEFEGRVRAAQAEAGIKELRGIVDSLLIIPNDRLFHVTDENAPTQEAFRKADEVLRQAIQSLSEVITTEGDINMDLNDIKAIMTGAGEALMGVGEAEGPDRAIEAARQAISSPLLENVSVDGAKGIIVNFVGARRHLTLAVVKEAMEFVHRSASPDAKVKFGQVFDEDLGNRLRVTVVATGFPARRNARMPARGLLGAARGPLSPSPLLRDMAPRGEGAAASGPDEWGKPAFLRWKLRKLR
ncbi:MAG TPA: cell division protein FtsZ [Elusimicrobiota bacterium]|jgi:cell division protein FtsZ|nr:cell division protein FtsZ [Elusimicrobiota bacterium]